MERDHWVSEVLTHTHSYASFLDLIQSLTTQVGTWPSINTIRWAYGKFPLYEMTTDMTTIYPGFQLPQEQKRLLCTERSPSQARGRLYSLATEYGECPLTLRLTQHTHKREYQ